MNPEQSGLLEEPVTWYVMPLVDDHGREKWSVARQLIAVDAIIYGCVDSIEG